MRYDSLEEMPPALRKRVEEQLARERTAAQIKQRYAQGAAEVSKSAATALEKDAEALRQLSRDMGANRQEKKPESKYHNQKTKVMGREFDSRHEAERYMQLRSMEQSGIISDLRCQVPYELVQSQRVCGKMIRASYYIADFVYNRDGEEVVEDAKGVKTAVYQLKKKLMAVNYGILVQEV